jgi:hypothetical protein
MTTWLESLKMFGRPQVSSTASFSRKTPVLESFTASMRKDISEVSGSLQDASEAFLSTYNAKLDALLSVKTVPRQTLVAEEVVDRVEVGVGAWAASLVTMAAVVAGVLIEHQRSKYYPAEL